MPNVYSYVRVSSIAQADSGLGLQVQRDQIESYFETDLRPRGFTWGRHLEDAAVSGRLPLTSRPAGRQLAGLLQAGDVVVFTHLDRGFRNLEDLLTTHRLWSARGIQLHILELLYAHLDPGTALGKLVLSMAGAIAEFERARIAERTREAKAVAKRQGRKSPPARPGLTVPGRKGRQAGPEPAMRAVGERIVLWRFQGYSWQAIYRHLVKRGEGLWNLRAIRRAFVTQLRRMAGEEAARLRPKNGRSES
jgi:DNA invertase Pin-like site-specific DNA recombinase